jgi:hypothetical protein
VSSRPGWTPVFIGSSAVDSSSGVEAGGREWILLRLRRPAIHPCPSYSPRNCFVIDCSFFLSCTYALMGGLDPFLQSLFFAFHIALLSFTDALVSGLDPLFRSLLFFAFPLLSLHLQQRHEIFERDISSLGLLVLRFLYYSTARQNKLLGCTTTLLTLKIMIVILVDVRVF